MLRTQVLCQIFAQGVITGCRGHATIKMILQKKMDGYNATLSVSLA